MNLVIVAAMIMPLADLVPQADRIAGREDSSADNIQNTATKTIDSTTDFITAFAELCAANFPNDDDFLTAMKGNAYLMQPAPRPNAPHRWAGSNVNMVYADNAMMNRARRTGPQCIMTGQVQQSEDHLAMATRIAGVLKLDAGQSEGQRSINKTVWNYQDSGGNRLRLFLQSQKTGLTVIALRMTLLRLAPQKSPALPPELEDEKDIP